MALFHYIIVRMHTIPDFVLILSMEFIQILIICNNTFKLIHKKCHEKNYHNNIIYHMILNTILSVVCSLEVTLCSWFDTEISYTKACWLGLSYSLSWALTNLTSSVNTMT